VDGSQRHVLVVDDDDRIRDLLKRFLTRAGLRVTTAADAAAPANWRRRSTST
jgi:two-component system phosphate regulon response regulator OmpR